MKLQDMERDAWISVFIDELKKLRPHLAPGFSTSKIALAIATQAYAADGKSAPKAAARRYHSQVAGRGPAKP